MSTTTDYPGLAPLSGVIISQAVTMTTGSPRFFEFRETGRQESEPCDAYTQEQFHADIKKASKPLEAMANKARADLKAGKGRKFPE